MALWSLAARAGIPAARSALRFLSRLKKPPKLLDPQKLTKGITVYRGEPFKHVMPKKEMAKMYRPTGSKFDFNNPLLRKMAMGRWFSQNPKDAIAYAGNRRFLSLFKNPKDVLTWGGGYQKGRIKKLNLTAKQANVANRLANRLHGLPSKSLEDFFIVPKKSLAAAETDKLRSFIANMYRMAGKKHGGLARILEV